MRTCVQARRERGGGQWVSADGILCCKIRARVHTHTLSLSLSLSLQCWCVSSVIKYNTYTYDVLHNACSRARAHTHTACSRATHTNMHAHTLYDFAETEWQHKMRWLYIPVYTSPYAYTNKGLGFSDYIRVYTSPYAYTNKGLGFRV